MGHALDPKMGSFLEFVTLMLNQQKDRYHITREKIQ